ncbi:MAG: hypothetical protein J5842_02430 [Lachnospiraceae bacterium]|nr:hypothetical protein [Lachnospiraceae bacterium]
MGFLSVFRVPARIIAAHLQQNESVWEEKLKKRKESGDDTLFIEDQGKLGDMIYGKESGRLNRIFLGGRKLSASENACEVIAVYNAFTALRAIGKDESIKDFSFPGLISEFEKKGISLWGYFGTSFGAVIRFVKASGLKPYILRGKKITQESLMMLHDEKQEQAECGISQDAAGFKWNVCIMMAENTRGKIKDMVHTICITRKDHSSDIWKSHNDYEGSREYASLKEAVLGYHNGKGRPLGLILL